MEPRYAEWMDSDKPVNPWLEYWSRVRCVPLAITLQTFVALPVIAIVVRMTSIVPTFFSTASLIAYFGFRYVTEPWRRALQHDSPDDSVLLSLVGDPSPRFSYPIDIEVFHDNVVIGEDSGAITFVDGWLVFHGLRCSFSLTNQDVRGREWISHGLRGRRYQQHVRLEIREPSKHLSILILPRSVWGFFNSQPLRVALEQWANGPKAQGKPVFPPREVHPITRFRRWLIFWRLFLLVPLGFVCTAELPMGSSCMVMAVLAVVASVIGWLNTAGYATVLSRIGNSLPASRVELDNSIHSGIDVGRDQLLPSSDNTERLHVVPGLAGVADARNTAPNV